MMVTDADQVDRTLMGRFVRGGKALSGQMCLNDDVATGEEGELRDVMSAMSEFYGGVFPGKSCFES